MNCKRWLIVALIEDTRTIQQARAELKRWGAFWRSYFERGAGGSLMANFIQSQKSATKYHRRIPVSKEGDRINRLCGIDIPYTADCSPTRSSVSFHDKEIYIPWSLRDLNDLIESMQPECAKALKQCYVNNDREGAKGYWLDKAERLVVVLI